MDERSTAAKSGFEASVVIVTLSRPDFLRTCLEHLQRQTVPAKELVVVDASPGAETRRIVLGEFPAVTYLVNERGAGSTGYSRNIGLKAVSGDIVAFVDDDAFAFPDWLEKLLDTFADPTVGGVGGRARNGRVGEEGEGLDDIGRLHPDGTLSGNFAADSRRTIEVDHVLGANMSFRRQVLLDVGGIRDGYPGTCLREETDLAFRVRAAGWRLRYNPAACVDHVAAPYPKGRRFDLRYDYFAHRNHIVLLARNLGFSSRELRGYLRVAASDAGRQLGRIPEALHPGDSDRSGAVRVSGAALARAGVITAGAVVGLGSGLRQRRLDRVSPG